MLTSALQFNVMEHSSILSRGLGFITNRNWVSTISNNGSQSDLPMPQRIEPVKHFQYFNNLPVEIRLEIWRRAFTPRKVDLREGVQDPTNPNHFIDRPCRRAKSSLPPTAFVNRESREETLRHYCRLIQPLEIPPRRFSPATIEILKLFFPASRLVEKPGSTHSTHNIIYWHPQMDSIFLTMEALCNPSIAQYLLEMFQDSYESSHYIDSIKEMEVYCTMNREFDDRGVKTFIQLTGKYLDILTLVIKSGPDEWADRRLTIRSFKEARFNRRNRLFVKFDVRIDSCIEYYIRKNEQELAKLDRIPYGLLPVVGWVGWYVYLNRQYMKQVAGYLFGW